MAALSWTSYFSDLARYNVWATERLSSVIAAMDESDYYRDVGLFFKSVHGTLNHLLVGEHLLWFRRFDEGVSPMVALDAHVQPGPVEVTKALQDGALRWEGLIKSWPIDRWDGVLNYTTTRGPPACLLPRLWRMSSTMGHTTVDKSRQPSRTWVTTALYSTWRIGCRNKL